MTPLPGTPYLHIFQKQNPQPYIQVLNFHNNINHSCYHSVTILLLQKEFLLYFFLQLDNMTIYSLSYQIYFHNPHNIKAQSKQYNYQIFLPPIYPLEQPFPIQFPALLSLVFASFPYTDSNTLRMKYEYCNHHL